MRTLLWVSMKLLFRRRRRVRRHSWGYQCCSSFATFVTWATSAAVEIHACHFKAWRVYAVCCLRVELWIDLECSRSNIGSHVSSFPSIVIVAPVCVDPWTRNHHPRRRKQIISIQIGSSLSFVYTALKVPPLKCFTSELPNYRNGEDKGSRQN